MHTISLFNHKGGVGKTTLVINLADAFVSLGKKVLVVDSDPQCNLSAFYLPEKDLDELLAENAENASATPASDGANTLWSAVEPVVLGRGAVRDMTPVEVADFVHLLIGDVLLSQYEEELPIAWTESFARKTRGYDVTCALARVVRSAAERVRADVVLYDVGPNVGPLNRAILLDSDYFITPVHTDLYSLRALTTVGRAISRWIADWRTIRQLAGRHEQDRLLSGTPHYLGYISSAYKVYGGRKAQPHEYWERQLPNRVKLRVVDELRSVDPALVGEAPHKLGEVKHFHSLAAVSQEYGLPISQLRGSADSGQYDNIDEITEQFRRIAQLLLRRMQES